MDISFRVWIVTTFICLTSRPISIIKNLELSLIICQVFLLYMCVVPSTIRPEELLTPISSTIDVGSSKTLTCAPLLPDASQYNGANVKLIYGHSPCQVQ